MSLSETQTKPWRILDVIQWGTEFLQRHGVPQPRLSMELILAKVLGIKRLDLYLQFERPMSAVQLAQAKTLLRQRQGHVPTQHILGEWDFYGMTFWVNQHVLIPRPETEILVESLLNALRKNGISEPSYGLDIGTGSGNIALSLLAHLPESRCVAIDISAEATDQAKRNAVRHGLSRRLDLRVGDLFEPVKAGQPQQFGWIVSNPPYVAEEEWADLPAEVRQHEPRQALWGGKGGLDFYPPLIKGALRHLVPGGWLALEIGSQQDHAVQEMIRESDGFDFVEAQKDLAGVERVILARRRTASG